MLRNHFKLILRSLNRSKGYTGLNILGLTSGLMVFILITLYTTYEFSFDSHHENGADIYRVYKADADNFYQGSNKFGVTPGPLAPTLMEEYPEVLFATRLANYGNTLVKVGDEVFMEPKIHISDPETFQIFSFQSITGNLNKFLAESNTVALSKSMAIKYFGRTDVLGEVIYYQNEHPMTVSGVFEDMPQNSHFVLEVVFQFESAKKIENQPIDGWGNSSYHTFLLMSPGANGEDLQGKMPELRAMYADDPIDEDGQDTEFIVQSLSEVHFTQGVNFDIAPTSDPQKLYIYLGIAFMVLIIAGINYVNLATARAINRTKEIGVRKVVGANSRNLVFQFMLESFVLIFVSMLLALVFLLLIVPSFGQFVDRPLIIDLTDPKLIMFLLGLLTSLTILAGIYPSIILTSFKPITALKGKAVLRRSGTFFRNVLVVFQFAISSGLIIAATILSEQLSFIQNVDTGYVRDQIIVINLRDKSIQERLATFKQEISRIPGVISASASSSLPNNITSSTTAKWPGKVEEVRIPIYTGSVDYDFFDLFELEIIDGESFDPHSESDKKGVILNQAAVTAIGWDDPIGREFISDSGDTGRVVGVVKNFNQHSLHLGISPLQLFFKQDQRRISIKLSGDDLAETIDAIKRKYNDFGPDYPFDYSYFDDIFDRAYQSEEKTASLAQWFTGLTILIACLGLYGLAANKIQLRVKEVGIRKVMGASIGSILTLLTKDFVKLLIISFLIASPLTYYIMSEWLNGFAYHINIGILTISITFIAMILIAGLTIGYRTYIAAVRNPVEALREE